MFGAWRHAPSASDRLVNLKSEGVDNRFFSIVLLQIKILPQQISSNAKHLLGKTWKVAAKRVRKYKIRNRKNFKDES